MESLNTYGWPDLAARVLVDNAEFIFFSFFWSENKKTTVLQCCFSNFNYLTYDGVEQFYKYTPNNRQVFCSCVG